MGPNGTPILRMPGPKPPGPRSTDITGTAPHDTVRVLRDGSHAATYTANDGTPTLLCTVVYNFDKEVWYISTEFLLSQSFGNLNK